MTDAIGVANFGTRPQGVQSSADNNAGNTKFLVRAVVIHTLCDPSLRDLEADNDILQTLKNPFDYMRAPRNSVICRIIEEGQGRIEGSDIVCFPFFSSHISLPVKAGEQVWLFFENASLQNSRPYWLSRISEPIFVEDANFTHGDRRGSLDIREEDLDDGSGNFVNPRTLTFSNGSSVGDLRTTLSGDEFAFEKLIKNSKEASQTIIEPVPRVTKRPGDLVLQGSNNAAIRLCTVAGWRADRRPTKQTTKSIVSDIASQKSGAIDIVVGRGKYFRDQNSEKKQPKDSAANNTTRPLIEQNSLDTFETDKNAATQTSNAINAHINPQEGDPDFLLDASRIFLTENADIDQILGTEQTQLPASFDTEKTAKIGAAIALKSRHLRIVAGKSQLQARKGSEPDDIENESSFDGSIRIIKEGEKNDDAAMISLEDDGEVQVSGSKIFLGRKTDDGGAGGGPGPGESQPYIRYSDLDALLQAILDDIKNFAQSLQQNFMTSATPGFGGPDPCLIKSVKDCASLVTSIEKRRSEIKNIKSKRIFGE